MTPRKAIAIWGLLVLVCVAVVYAQGTRIEPGNLRVTGTSLNLGSAPMAQAAIQMNSGSPLLIWQETDAASDNKVWDILVTAEEWILRAVNDAYSSAGAAITITRTGTQVDTVILGAAATLNTGRYNSASAQPGFFAYNSASDTCASGAGPCTVEFDTATYNTGSSFSTTTDTFTAPVTGIYTLCARVAMSEATNANQYMEIVTSNRTYRFDHGYRAVSSDAVDGCIPADMDASDTAFVRANTNIGEDLTIAGTGAIRTFFSGRLEP